jgi:hypothetical protein
MVDGRISTQKSDLTELKESSRALSLLQRCQKCEQEVIKIRDVIGKY